MITNGELLRDVVIPEAPAVPIVPPPSLCITDTHQSRFHSQRFPCSMFVLWGDEDEGFLCVEPWKGGPNSLNTGRGRTNLRPGESTRWGFRISVTPEQ